MSPYTRDDSALAEIIQPTPTLGPYAGSLPLARNLCG